MRTERAAALVLLLATAAGAQPPATEGQAAWHLASPLSTAEGQALWLDDGAGSWRLEIGVAGEDLDLASRWGEGWTLASAGGPALVQPWGEPWRETSPDFTAAVARLLGRWSGGVAAPRPAPTPWRARLAPAAVRDETLVVGTVPQAWNPGGLADAPAGTLRRDLAARGRGRGGPGLRLQVRPAPDGGLALTSARWPGRLTLGPAATSARNDVPAEAYLPIWSLTDIGLSPRQR